MANAEKIAIIGAGSVQFSMDIVRDITLTQDLQGSEVVFMDIDQERLAMIMTLAKRFNNEVGGNIYFSETKDRKGAIEDSRFVVNIALAGGHQAMEEERDIQQQRGYYHGIAVHAPYRQLELMHNVANDVEQYAKSNAYILQSANPLPEGCTIMTRETNANVIGLCNGFLEYEKILEVTGLPQHGIVYEATGINHNIWMAKLLVNGKDAYPDIDNWIVEKSKEYWRTWGPEFDETQMSPAAINLYKLYDLMPIGDTCRASWPEAWWYHLDPETKKSWWGPRGGHDGEEGWKLHLEWLKERQKQIVTAIANPNTPISNLFPAVKSREQLVPIIDAITNDKPSKFQVNVPNNGAIPGLPDNFVVEVPATIDANGVQVQKIETLPDSVMFGALYPRWIFAERIIATYKTGDLRFMLQAYLSDNRTKSREQAEETIDATVSMIGNETFAKKVNNFRK
jgi:alpha-galactosidase